MTVFAKVGLFLAGLVTLYSGFTFAPAMLGGGSGTLEQLPQFVGTTSPSSAITQQVFGKAVRITGLNGCDTIDTTSNGTLVCGTDASGGGAGSSDVVLWQNASTSLWKPAALITLASSTIHKLNTTYASTSLITIGSDLISDFSTGFTISGAGVVTLDTSGTWLGNAVTATGLAANGSNCSAGSAAGGVSATGVAEDCTDYWSEAENTAAGYVAGTRALTIAGTANQIMLSAGSQNLTADRTWTISLANHIIFPGSYVAASGTTTNATSTNFGGSFFTAIGSSGLDFHSSNGTSVLQLGSGGGSNATFFGGVNIDGSTRLATTLTGLLGVNLGQTYAISTSTNFVTSLTAGSGISLTGSTGAITISSTNTGTVATSSNEVADQIPVFTTTSGTPAQIAGDTGFTFDRTNNRLVVGDTSATAGSIALYPGSGGNFLWQDNWTDGGEQNFRVSYGATPGTVPLIVVRQSGRLGIGTTTPGTKLSVNGGGVIAGELFARTFQATSTQTANTFPYASSTALSATTVCVGSDCRTSWPATPSTDVVTWTAASTSPWAPLSILTVSSSSIAFLDSVRATSTSFVSTNATTTQQYVATHLYSAGTTRINVTSGLLSTGATGVIQNTTVSSPLGFSANTLTCTTCATFGYPYTPATSWFSTSTIYLNTAGIMSNASSTFHILRNTYASSTYASFGTASTSALVISGIGSAANGCLTITSAGVVGAAACAAGGGIDYNKWATSTGSMLGINPLTAFFVGIGTSTPRSLLSLATSTAPQLTLSDSFASYDSWNFRSIAGTLLIATSSMATNATSTQSAITIGSDGVVRFGNRTDTCIALTGSSDLCDGVDSGGVGGTSAASKWATTTGSSLAAIYATDALRIGVGTTSPWGVFSANSNSRPQLMLSDTNLTTGMKHWVASTTPLGRLVWGTINDAYTTITSVMSLSTSTKDYAGYNVGWAFGTSTEKAYYGLGTSTDQIWVDGRINTGDWHFNECQSTGSRTAQVTADQTGSVISTTLGRPCEGWMFNEDSAGVLDETVMNGYSYFRLRAGAVGTFNAAAGEGMGIHHTTSWMNFASNTPKVSAATRFGAIQNATTSLYMIGFGSMTGTAADLAALPTYFVGVVSSTTEANWIAVIKNGNSWQYKNTGVASSSALVGETAWGTWDIQVSSTTAEYIYRGTNGIATTTNVLVTGGAGGTEGWIPTHNGLRVTPVVSTGKPTIGLQQELHVRWIRLWWRDLIF